MSTIADVAKLAGVSTGTVSRVMNGATNVNPDTRLRVEQAIADLAYQPNFQARSLRNKRTDMIALAIPELTNYFWTTVARGVQSAAQSNGYHVLICETSERSHQGLRYLESIYSRVDGMILSRRSEWAVLTGGDAQTSGQTMVAREKPIVVVGQSQAANWNVDNIYSDSISGAFALVEHLIRLGHRRIAIITGRQSSASASDRVAGYCMALSDANIAPDPDLICWSEYERKTAQRVTHDLMERQPKTTAIVAANNEIGIGVMQALEKRHLPVPQAVAVVCFDDFYPDSRYAAQMTVASQSPYDVGINAAQLLLNRLRADQYLHPKTVMLPMRLIVRRSCGGTPNLVEANTAYDRVQGQLIPPLPPEKIEVLAADVHPLVHVTIPPKVGLLPQADRSLITLLKQALRLEGSVLPSIPHFEYAITSRSLYRYVLERDPQAEWFDDTALVLPEDQVEFARRSHIAAIACRFPYRTAISHAEDGRVKDNELLPFNFPRLTDQLNFFDRYIHAARSSSVGVVADFRSIVADTLAIHSTLNAANPVSNTALLQRIADSLFSYQSKVVQLICDRFGSELAFVLFSDQWADENGLQVPVEVFETVFSQHLRQLIHPAKEHGLSTVLYTPGRLEPCIPLIQQTGFDAVYVAQPEYNDLALLNIIAQGTLSFMGGIPNTLLHDFHAATVEEKVFAAASLPMSGCRYVAGVSPAISGDFPAANYSALLRTLSDVNIG
jgi:LacI family transcriptional regulator